MANERVGVIFGGRSTEHEVSVVTGIQVMRLLAKRHAVIPIYITKDGAWFTGKKLTELDSYKGFSPKDTALEQVVITPDTGLRAILNPLPKGLLDKPKKLELDVVFPTMHGMNGEDGTLQGLLELANLPYVGSGVLASAICIDKVATKVALRGAGIPVLDYLGFSRAEWERDEDSLVARVEAMFSYPVMIKPARLGSSIGIAVAHSRDDLKFNVSVASHFDSKIIIERFIRDRLEINCSVLGNLDPVASVCEQPLSKEQFLSFEDKYLQNQRERGMEGAKRIIPAPISSEMTLEIQRMAIQAFRAVDGRGIARVDFIIDQDNGELYVNELNTLPGSFSFYLWEPTGINPEELVDRLVDLAMQESREKNKTNFTSGNQLFSHSDFLGLKKA
ncbi:MAG: D-alanine--D-alanine ligase [Anaerolineaceae bacterium]|nr:D-alanine--D-alanine ligase [Anaerolineaceae bacterium]